LQLLVTDIRSQRKDRGVPEREFVPLQLSTKVAAKAKFFEANSEIIRSLGRISEVQFVSAETFANRPGIRNGVVWDIDVVYEKQIDVAAERERLTKDIAKYEKGLASAERQLGNEAFLAKAPAPVVDGLKKQEAETRLLLEKARAALAALPG
jgi:valyl-tRNA synthetase